MNVGQRSHLYPLATPPLGCLYIAGYLRSKFSLDIQVINQRIEGCSFEEVARRAVDFGADIVGLGSMTPTAHGMPVIASAVRALKPDTFIALLAGDELLDHPALQGAGPVQGDQRDDVKL